MLRPATPLTILLFVAFVLLLISVISTPVVKSIPLASFQGVDFGVFGYCGKTCSGIKVGYATNIGATSGTGASGDQNFSLPSSARSSLSSILIVHPIAALFTLICLVLAASAHLHEPSHSPRYLLVLLILLLPTLLITLLAFLVDILLFVPHLAWGGWIVLGSTILITASGVVTCAMRRTLVSRKARKKRIAENAEMNGENFYNRQNAARVESPPPLERQATLPMANGGPRPDQLPAFATYDSKNPGVTDEECIPLNTRTPSNKTLPSNGITNEASEDGSERYGAPGRAGPEVTRGGRAGPYNGLRDEFGNPLPSSNAFGPVPLGPVRRDSSDARVGHQYSYETLNSQGSRGRGRGGYPPRGYGRGGPPHGLGRGPGMNGNGRGIPMGPIAAGGGVGMMTGERGRYRQDGPPPGYAPGYGPGPGNGFTQGRGMPSQFNREISSGPGGAAMYGRDPSASGYGRRTSPGPPSAPGHGRQPSPGPPSAPGYGREPSPGPPSAPGYGRQPSPGPPSAPGYGRQPSPGPPSAPGNGRQPSPGPPSAPGYGRQPSPRPPSAPGYGRQSPGPPLAAGYRRQSPGRQSPGPPSAPGVYGYGREPSPGPQGTSQYRADSPPPPMPQLQHNENHIIGQAVEMDAYTGSPSHTPVSNRVMHLRDGDHDAHAVIGQQQQQHRESPTSITSDYSAQEPYVPPRAAWVGGESHSSNPPQNSTHPLSPIHASPVELPAQSPPHNPEPQPPAPPHDRINSTENYYEDVDPRFTEPQPPQPLPTSLMPGGNHPNGITHLTISREGSPSHIEPSTSYESIQEGARSHASDASNFTSISQRGINPNWRPPSGPLGAGMGGVPDRRPVQRDVLQTNPDFELPAGVRGARMLGSRGGRGGGRAPGMIPGMGPGVGGRYPGGEV